MLADDMDDENDIAALRARHKQQRQSSSGIGLGIGAAVAERRTAERKATTPRMAINDGRKTKATGRTAQLNVTIRPEVKELAIALASARGSTMVSLIEELIEEAATTPGN